jgi:Holliday junction resolvase RusA-like endonuclease
VTAAAPPAVAFIVTGLPQTKGSLRQWHRWAADGKCVVGLSEQGGARLKEWRALIATQAARAMRQAPPFTGPLRVELAFWFPLPRKTTPATHGGMAHVWGNKRHDIDKLARACLDALGDASVYGDDSQVAELVASKRYVQLPKRYVQLPGDAPGVFITVEPLTREGSLL